MGRAFGPTRHGGLWPSFSADGKRMAYIVPPGRVRVMGPDLDEASSRLVHAPPAPGTDGIWVDNGVISPDGATFIAKGEDKVGPEFWRLPIAGGAARLLMRLDDPRRTSPRPEFASDGRRLFFLLIERESDVWAVRLEARLHKARAAAPDAKLAAEEVREVNGVAVTCMQQITGTAQGIPAPPSPASSRTPPECLLPRPRPGRRRIESSIGDRGPASDRRSAPATAARSVGSPPGTRSSAGTA